MSHIGKKGVIIPEKVELKTSGNEVSVKGPLGELKKVFCGDVEILVEGNAAKLILKKHAKNKAVWGTYTSLLNNMIRGVIDGFEKKMIIEGIGFKAALEGKNISLNVGLSHSVKIEIPDGIKITVEKNLITAVGPDKEKLGQFCADVRAVKKPEPYKGTGIRYEKEIIRRKAGKKAATAAA